MIHLLILAVHLLATIAKLVRPGGVRAVVAESLVLKQQLLISSRMQTGDSRPRPSPLALGRRPLAGRRGQ